MEGRGRPDTVFETGAAFALIGNMDADLVQGPTSTSSNVSGQVRNFVSTCFHLFFTLHILLPIAWPIVTAALLRNTAPLGNPNTANRT